MSEPGILIGEMVEIASITLELEVLLIVDDMLDNIVKELAVM